MTTWLEIGLAFSGVVIIFFAARALMTDHAWGDGAEYEMLGLETPSDVGGSADGGPSFGGASGAALGGPVPDERGGKNPEGHRGWLGIEDRIVRVGIGIGSGFLAFTWFGKGTPAMWILVTVSAYSLITFIAGRDPIYKKMGWSTRF